MNKRSLKITTFSLCCLVLLCSNLRSETAREKLETAVEEYENLTQQIAAEKRPLAEQINEKRTRAAQLRAKADSLLLSRSEFDRSVKASRAESLGLSKQLDFIKALAHEHNVDFESFLSAAEDQRYREQLNTLRSEISANSTLETRLKLIDLSFEKLSDSFRLPHFSGQAIAGDGSLVQGRFLSIGPTTYFLSNDDKTLGQAALETNSLMPEIRFVPGLDITNLKAALDQKPASIPLDPTLGKAREVEKAHWNLIEQIEKGGKVGLVILAIALIALIVALIKSIQFLRIRSLDTVNYQEIIESIEARGNADDLMRTLPEEARRLMSQVEKHLKDSKEIIQERLLGQLEFTKRRFESALPILAITAATAPLLGLLGTVVGMIKTFALINVYGSGEAKAFSAGISEALITTEFGLVVAIPALIAHGFLQRTAKRKMGHLEDLAANVLISIEQKAATNTHVK